MHRKHLVAALAAVALAGSTIGAPAVADDPSAKPTVKRWSRGLISPLSLAVSDDGTVYYSQNFAGTLLRKKPGKQPKVIYQDEQGNEVGAVSERKRQPAVRADHPRQRGGRGRGRRALGRRQAAAKPKRARRPVQVREEPQPRRRRHLRSARPARRMRGARGLPAVPRHRRVPPLRDRAGEGPDLHRRRGGQHDRQVRQERRSSRPSPCCRPAGASPRPCPPRRPARSSCRSASSGRSTSSSRCPPTSRSARTATCTSAPPGWPEDGSLGAHAAVYRINPETGKVRKVAPVCSARPALRSTTRATSSSPSCSAAGSPRSRPVRRPREVPRHGAAGRRRSSTTVTCTPPSRCCVGPEGPDDPTPPGGEVRADQEVARRRLGSG